MKTMLEYFRGTPRKSQSDILQALQSNWKQYDVFVIQAPVATGKSRIAVSVADWVEAQGRTCAILTPSNILASQYAEEFPDLALLSKRTTYRNPSQYAESLYNFRSSAKEIGRAHV